jgi:hypothetical protein
MGKEENYASYNLYFASFPYELVNHPFGFRVLNLSYEAHDFSL